jgi:hypothetical protein
VWFEDVDWIHLAEDGDSRQAVVISLRFRQKAEISFCGLPDLLLACQEGLNCMKFIIIIIIIIIII